jgi:hypothetical protein
MALQLLLWLPKVAKLALDDLATLSRLRVLEICHAAAAAAAVPSGSVSLVYAWRWRSFSASLLRPKSLRLPPSVDVAAADLRRLRFNG